jgi:hypothetical protein
MEREYLKELKETGPVSDRLQMFNRRTFEHSLPMQSGKC